MTGATLRDARTIIALLDQSPLDECAVRHAERMAGPTGRLLLIQVLPSHSLAGAAPEAAHAAAAHQYLELLARRLAAPCQTDTRVLYGDAADAILEQLSEHKANLVVMAMPAGHGFADRTSGCVAMHVLSRSAVPVCVVRPGRGSFGPRRVVPSPRVLVPLDGSEFA
jgi:nucleotide-binding universal stress UspA family protein